MIDWKEAARHYRYHMMLADQQEGRLKRRLHDEHERWVALANTLADVLLDIAYDSDDTNHDYCNVCHRSLIEEDGHQTGCLLIVGLAAIADASRSTE